MAAAEGEQSPVEYYWRKSITEKGQRQLILADTFLEEKHPGGGGTRIRFEDIKSVRLTAAPTRFKLNRYLLTVKSATGAVIAAENTTFREIGNFTDQSGSFNAFVKSLFKRLSVQRPDLLLDAGAPPLSYFGQLVFVSVVLAVLGLVLLSVPLGTGGLVVLVKLGIMAFFLPFLFSWVIKARPRRYPLNDVPADFFPKSQSASTKSGYRFL